MLCMLMYARCLLLILCEREVSDVCLLLIRNHNKHNAWSRFTIPEHRVYQYLCTKHSCQMAITGNVFG